MRGDKNQAKPKKGEDSQGFKGKFKAYWKKFRLTKWLIFIGLFFALIFESYLLISAKMTDVDNLEKQLQVTTEVYDNSGNLAGTLSSDHGTYVTIDQISDNIKNAVVSTEDKRFYKHRGFDPIGIARAAVGYVLHGGSVVGGGSTLTQQLVKNSFLTNEQSLMRKFKELFIALEIEKTYPKDKILEMYLNHSYFGNGVYGVEDASQKYFGSSAANLDLANAAVLAGALKGPSIYNPVDNYEETINRRNTVLQLMADNGFVAQEDAQMAMASDMPQQNNDVGSDQYKYPYYFDAVIEEAINKHGLSEDDLMKGGYRIYTNLDPKYQEGLQGIYDQSSLFPISPAGNTAQSATVVMDPYSGGVLATVGGTGGHSFRGFNRATQMKRQPGSTLKPLNVYSPALENGFEANDVIPDEVKEYGTDKYKPENHDKQSQGEILLWQALAKSKNTSAVWLMNEIGVNTAMAKLDDFGIPYTDGDKTLSSALGGLSKGASPMEMASAYTAFVNKGKRSEGVFIQKIVDSSGNVIVEEQKPKQNQALSEADAKEMTRMMLDVYNEGGTGAAMEPAGYELAGKTGTVELSQAGNSGAGDGVNDEWYVAYTPDMVVASWYGFDQTSSENYLWNSSPVQSGNTFHNIMAELLANSPNTPFNLEAASTRYYNEVNGISSSDGDETTSNQATIEDNASSLLDRLMEGARDFFSSFSGQITFQNWLGMIY